MVGGEVSGKAKRSILAYERKECPWVKGSSAHVVGEDRAQGMVGASVV